MTRATTEHHLPRHRLMGLGLLLLLLASWQVKAQGEGQPGSTPLTTRSLGVSRMIEQIVLPGTRLTHKKMDPTSTPLIVRVVRSFPHGDSFRYDISYFGLTEGEFDLRDFLVREDGSTSGDLPSLPVTVNAVLADNQIEPNQLEVGGLSKYGGYWKLLWLGAITWALVLIFLVVLGRPRKIPQTVSVAKKITLAELLKPSVEKAIAGELPKEKRAELERLLFSFWQKKLDLGDLDPADALNQIRNHQESGPLLRQVETWLHSPRGCEETTDMATLLAPYQKYDADELDQKSRLAQNPCSPRPDGETPGGDA